MLCSLPEEDWSLIHVTVNQTVPARVSVDSQLADCQTAVTCGYAYDERVEHLFRIPWLGGGVHGVRKDAVDLLGETGMHLSRACAT